MSNRTLERMVDEKDGKKVSSLYYWRFVFPTILLVVLLGCFYFLMAMPDTFLTDSTAFKAVKNTVMNTNNIS
jgi:hypothetical protein